MRSVLAAAILAMPALLPAQALHTGVSHLVASVDAPAFAFQANAVQAGAVQANAVKAAVPHMYTGLIAPVRLNALKLAPASIPAKGEVVVEYTVDKAGVPQNIEVKQALDKTTDERVVAAVRQIRYTPGKLDGQVVDVPVSLHVVVNQ
jgi:TonB family protein